jgi:hypothetical protein
VTDTRKFHAGDILSVLTPHMVSPGGTAAIGALLSFMAGEPVMLHQFKRVAAECAPALASQHPELAAITIPADALTDRETGLDWLATLRPVMREVQPLAAEDHTSIHPVDEMRMVAPHVRIIPVACEPEADSDAS